MFHNSKKREKKEIKTQKEDAQENHIFDKYVDIITNKKILFNIFN